MEYEHTMCAKCRIQNCDHLGYYAKSNDNSLNGIITVHQKSIVLIYFMPEA
jgi:hypothetical protein